MGQHAVFEMPGQQRYTHGIERRAHCGDLVENIDAIAPYVDHPRNAVDLAATVNGGGSAPFGRVCPSLTVRRADASPPIYDFFYQICYDEHVESKIIPQSRHDSIKAALSGK